MSWEQSPAQLAGLSVLDLREIPCYILQHGPGCCLNKWLLAKFIQKSSEVSSLVFSIFLFLGQCLSPMGKRRSCVTPYGWAAFSVVPDQFHPPLVQHARAVCCCYTSLHGACFNADVMFEYSACIFLYCEGWKEDKLFTVPDLLMKNQTGLSRLLFLVDFVNMECKTLMEEAASLSDITYFIVIVTSTLILFYGLKALFLTFLWKCECWPFV